MRLTRMTFDRSWDGQQVLGHQEELEAVGFAVNRRDADGRNIVGFRGPAPLDRRYWWLLDHP